MHLACVLFKDEMAQKVLLTTALLLYSLGSGYGLTLSRGLRPRAGALCMMGGGEVEALQTLSQQASLLVADGGDVAIPSALTAYGHYAGLVLVSMSLAAERLLIKPKMSIENEKLLGYADIVYGIAGTLVLATGYFRVTEYGKGWEFYSHEPIFWVKMLLFAVMGASSLFPTIKIVQRAIAINNAEKGKGPMPELMSEALATRMTKVVNGELLAIGSIPLAASLMSRGVGYADSFPWQAGAGAVGLVVFGLGFKYTREALTFED